MPKGKEKKETVELMVNELAPTSGTDQLDDIMSKLDEKKIQAAEKKVQDAKEKLNKNLKYIQAPMQIFGQAKSTKEWAVDGEK